jgi:hypothetical protein
MRRVMLLPGALAAVLLAAACSASDPGPLGASGPIMAVDCAPNPPGQVIAVGYVVLLNGNAQLTVNTVRLTDNHGLAMGTPWLTPVFDDSSIGFGFPWPPAVKQFRAWRYRHLADGATVRPGQNPDLVIPVWRTGKKAGQSSITVYYTSGGNAYTWTSSQQVAIGNCAKATIPA